eukprot:1908374-Prymnesium_polylepis.1
MVQGGAMWGGSMSALAARDARRRRRLVMRTPTGKALVSLRAEFAERRSFYTEYVHFGGSFGIRILEHVWNTVGIL